MAKITVWKNGLEPKGLKVNTRKTKVIISGRDLYTSIHSILLVNILVQYAGKVSGRTQSSVVDVRF